MLSWPLRPQARSLSPLPRAAWVPCARHSESGTGKYGCAPRASSKRDHRHSHPIPRGLVVGVLSTHRCPDRRKEQAVEVSSVCPAQLPGDKAAKRCLSTRTPPELVNHARKPQILTTGPGGPGGPLTPGEPCKGSREKWIKRFRPPRVSAPSSWLTTARVSRQLMSKLM